MLKTYLYIPDELNEKTIRIAKESKKSKAEVLRNALEIGLEKHEDERNASASALLRIAEIGEKHNEQFPADLSTNLDHYLWGFEKKK